MDDHPVPRLLYHYTDAPGLRGIVESRTLWASHIEYLNDAQEYHHAAQVAARILLERAEGAVDPGERALLTRLGTGLSEGRGRADVCVVSFSTVDDGLSQWRGYCPNGAGYSLGFETRGLLRAAAMEGFRLAQCLYDDASQREAITRVLERVRQSVRWTQAVERPGNDDTYREAIRAWSESFAPLAPTIKHQAFHEEQEWRLISASIPFGDSRWQMRAGRSMLIPYIPFALAPTDPYLPIRDVVVGPTPHMELAVRATGILLDPVLEPMILGEPMARQPAQIRNSRIPYRNW